MIRGRHRGLPYKLDRAIVLPSERLEEDHPDSDKVQTKFDWKKPRRSCSRISVNLGTDKELEVGFVWDEDTTRLSVTDFVPRGLAV